MTRKQTFYGLAAVAVLALGIIAYYSSQGGTENLLASVGAAATTDIKPTDEVHGSASAPVTIIEYASMTCPHCAAFQREVVPQLTKDYIDTGKVKMVFREFPLDGMATMASSLARCQTGTAFFSFIDLLFLNQNKWIPPYDAAKQITRDDVVNNLAGMGRFAGMSREKVESCLNDKKNLDIVQANWQEGQTRYHVNSTPTFVVNGEVHKGEMTYENMKSILDPLIAKK